MEIAKKLVEDIALTPTQRHVTVVYTVPFCCGANDLILLCRRYKCAFAGTLIVLLICFVRGLRIGAETELQCIIYIFFLACNIGVFEN